MELMQSAALYVCILCMLEAGQSQRPARPHTFSSRGFATGSILQNRKHSGYMMSCMQLQCSPLEDCCSSTLATLSY